MQDMKGTNPVNKKGYEKIRRCCSVAKANGFEYVWIDTCCIDKTSSVELSEAINSMYRWYQESMVCYAYLADVSSSSISCKNEKSEFIESKWFTRGWTLQELIAPSVVIFLNRKWQEIGIQLQPVRTSRSLDEGPGFGYRDRSYRLAFGQTVSQNELGWLRGAS